MATYSDVCGGAGSRVQAIKLPRLHDGLAALAVIAVDDHRVAASKQHVR